VTSKYLSISTPAKIVCNDQDIVVADRNAEVNKDFKVLANIGVIRKQYWIYSLPGALNAEEELWILLRNYIGEDHIEGYKLSEGSVIKLGRCRYTVKELVIKSEGIKTVENFCIEKVECNSLYAPIIRKKSNILVEEILNEVASVNKGEEMQCRICLCEDDKSNNRLIESPCLCIGSTKLLHKDCLKQWLKSKVNKKYTNTATTYSWKGFECDICKAKYPGIVTSLTNIDRFRIRNEEQVDIINIEKPSCNYMILEIDPESLNGINMVHVIFLDNKDILRLVILLGKE